MKSIESVTKKINANHLTGWSTDFARMILFSRLQNITHGRLTVEDNGETFVFGQDANATNLVSHIVVKDSRFYAKVLFGGATGSGEAYMLNWWSSPDLVLVIRFFCANQKSLSNMESTWSIINKGIGRVGELFRRNTKLGSKRNICAHYDLSNEFFSLFLDESMMYSSAIFNKSVTNLEEASQLKLDHVCKRLNLTAEDHLLEIGTGWGGMAIHAAKEYGCKVTTTTISNEQYDYALARVRKENLEHRVTVLKKDYRELTGSYDKLVSIEMVEAVGHQFYKDFFSGCSRLLKENGVMLMQAITTQDQRFEKEKNASDFIRKYIFPGGCLPSNEVVSRSISRFTDMHIIGLEDITLDYALTLSQWRSRFFDSIHHVRKMGFDEVFIRMWDFYLCYCEGGFAERVINTSQFLFAKPGVRTMPLVGASS